MSPTTAPTSQRSTRFHCSSLVPRQFQVYLKVLEKEFRRLKKLDRKFIRTSALKLHKSASRGESDDALRFLLNYSIILPLDGSSTFAYDAQRGEYVLRCCQDGTEPKPQEIPPAVRLRHLLGLDSEPEPTSAACLAPEEEVMHKTEEIELQPVAAPMVPCNLIALFLDPVEKCFWESLFAASFKEDGRLVAEIPQDPAELFRLWADKGLDCSPDTFFRAFRKFESSQVIHRSDTSPDRFVFSHPHEVYRVHYISRREIRALPPVDLSIIQQIELNFVHPPTKSFGTAFADFVMRHCPGESVYTLRTKFTNYRPSDRYNGLGIIMRPPGGTSQETEVCQPGFEAYDFQEKTSVSGRPRVRSAFAASVVSAAVVDQPSPSVAAGPETPITPDAPAKVQEETKLESLPASVPSPEVFRNPSDMDDAALESLIKTCEEQVAAFQLRLAEARKESWRRIEAKKQALCDQLDAITRQQQELERQSLKLREELQQLI